MSATEAALPRTAARSRIGRWLIPIIVVVLLILLAFSTLQNAPLASTRPYDFYSAQPTGLLALRESLVAMGYEVRDVGGKTFSLPQDADLFLSWPGVEPWEKADANRLRWWVAGGRNAALFYTQYDYQGTFDEWMGDTYGYGSIEDSDLMQIQPLLPESPAEFAYNNFANIFEFDPHVVPLTEVKDSGWESTLGVERAGSGYFWYLSNAHDLTNANLRDENQTAVLASLLRGVPDGGTILFDAYHMYGPDQTPQEMQTDVQTIQDWLYTTPLGRATLLGLAIGVVGLVLSGRRLGPPLRTHKDVRRREGAEYVRAIAGLKRRAHTGNEIAARLRHTIKVKVGKPHQVAATLEDDRFIAALRASGAVASHEVDIVDTLLVGLRSAVNEQELVTAASAAQEYLDRKTIRYI